MDIGKNIKALREQQGITQKHLATLLGYKTHSIISDWESGKKLPPVDKLPYMTGILKCGYNDLLRPAGVKVPSDSLNEYIEKGKKLWENPETFKDIDFVIDILENLLAYNRKFKDMHFTEYHREWQNCFFTGLIKYFTSLKCQD